MTDHEILVELVKRFRWNWEHYDRCSCPSCGAIAYFDSDGGKPIRKEQCSPNCIWRKAEEVLISATTSLSTRPPV